MMAITLQIFLATIQVQKECLATENEDQLLLSLMQMANEEDSHDKTFEKDVLYHVCGYVLYSIKKATKLSCKRCIEFLTSNKKEIDDFDFDKLIQLRDYTGESLVYCSKEVFYKVFVPLEEYFLKLESKEGFLTQPNVRQTLVTHLSKKVSLAFPECCKEKKLKEKAIERYAVLRLKITAKEVSRKKRAEIKQKRQGGEKGSRSMSMKKAIETMH